MVTPPNSDQVFWKDELNTQLIPGKFISLILSYAKFGGIFIIFCGIVLLFALFFYISRPLAWGVVIYFILLPGLGIITGITRKKKWKRLQQEIAEVQRRASEKTGAFLIGSCIHVAGNPKLNRDQNIVLALTPEALVIYPYDRDIPLDTISLQQITAIHTVVYDDERTPHLEAVDSAAQALQLTIKHGNIDYDCLLRSMKNIRPIDWFHAIQKARIQVGV